MSVNLSFIGGAGWQFFDDNGNVLSGGKIYTYAAGTTTPLITYTSRDGLTPNPNPIILDAAGRTPQQIWATEGLLYKYVVTKANDVQIRVWDNIGGTVVASDTSADLANTTDNSKGDALVGFRQSNSAGFLTGAIASTVNNKLQDIISVKDFGAIGNGIADDTAAVQAALAYADSTAIASSGTAAVMFPAGVYKLTSGLVTGQNIRFIGIGWPIIKIAHNGDGITFTGVPSVSVFPRNAPFFEGLVFNTEVGSTPTSIIRLGTNSGDPITYINAVGDVNIFNCTFDQITATYIIDNNRGFGLIISSCRFVSLTVTAALKMRQSANEIPYWTYAVSIYASDFTNLFTGKAIEADGGDLTVFGSIIQGCRDGAVHVGMNTSYTGSQPVSFYGVYFEANEVFHFRSDNNRVHTEFNGCKFIKGSSASSTLTFASASQNTFISCSSPNQAPTISGGNIKLMGCNYMQQNVGVVDSYITDRNIAATSTPTTPYVLNGQDGYNPRVYADGPGFGGGGIVILCSHTGFPAASNSVVELFLVAPNLAGTAVNAVSLGRHQDGDTTTFSFGVSVGGYLTVTASQAGGANYMLISQSKSPAFIPG